MEVISWILGVFTQLWDKLDSIQTPYGVSYMVMFLGFTVMSLSIWFLIAVFGGKKK